MRNNFSSTQRGVVILFAVLLVSVVLTISLGIFNITYRQLVLSSIARESEIAFSVADSARNCALYWDSSERGTSARPFGYYSYDGAGFVLNPPDRFGLFCGNSLEYRDPWPVTTDDSDPLVTIYSFQLRLMIPDPVITANSREACAKVSVLKNKLDNGQDPLTTIKVDGYNLSKPPAGSPDDDCLPTDLNRAVQRSVETVING